MAKVQTRVSISVSRDAYRAAKAKCDAEGRALAGVVDAFLRELTGLPPNRLAHLGPETEAVPPSRVELDMIAAAKHAAPRAGFCAVCTASTPAGASLQPLGRNGALVIVCGDCNTTHPRGGRYTFSEASAPSRATVGGNDGNRCSRRGTSR